VRNNGYLPTVFGKVRIVRIRAAPRRPPALPDRCGNSANPGKSRFAADSSKMVNFFLMAYSHRLEEGVLLG
jgi:hypothetical protein